MGLIPFPGRRLSDADLIAARFRYTDPERSITGLNRGVPDPAANPTIIGYYDERPAGGRRANPNHPMVWCCHCGKRTHWDGRVVQDDRGETYIIGARVCGREHYGDRFENAERAFRAERERRRVLLSWANARSLLDGYLRELEAILGWPDLSAIERKRDELQRASPSGYNKLVRYVGTGTEMIAYRNNRDLAAEQARERKYEVALKRYRQLPPEERRILRDDGLAPYLDDEQIWVRTAEPLGHVIGGDFLLDNCDARGSAMVLRAAIDAFKAVEDHGTDLADAGGMIRILQHLRESVSSLLNAMHSLAFAEIFFSHENLDRLEQWSAQESKFTYTRKGRALLVEDSSRGISIVESLHELDFPNFDALRFSRHLDADFAVPLASAA